MQWHHKLLPARLSPHWLFWHDQWFHWGLVFLCLFELVVLMLNSSFKKKIFHLHLLIFRETVFCIFRFFWAISFVVLWATTHTLLFTISKTNMVTMMIHFIKNIRGILIYKDKQEAESERSEHPLLASILLCTCTVFYIGTASSSSILLIIPLITKITPIFLTWNPTTKPPCTSPCQTQLSWEEKEGWGSYHKVELSLHRRVR